MPKPSVVIPSAVSTRRFRRGVAGLLIVALAAMHSGGATSAAEPARSASKPNIIFILADDKYEALKAKSPFMRQNAGNYG